MTNEKKYKIETYDANKYFILYDLYVYGELKGQIDAQLDNEEFNGKAFYADFASEDGQGEFEWEPVKDEELIALVRNELKN